MIYFCPKKQYMNTQKKFEINLKSGKITFTNYPAWVVLLAFGSVLTIITLTLYMLC